MTIPTELRPDDKYIIDVDVVLDALHKAIMDEWQLEREAKAKKLKIDINELSETPPGYERADRKMLASWLGHNPQLYTDWKGGKVAGVIARLFMLMDLGKMDVKGFIKKVE